MHAHATCIELQIVAGNCLHSTFLHQPNHPFSCHSGVGDDCAFDAAGYQRTIVIVGTVSKSLARYSQARIGGSDVRLTCNAAPVVTRRSCGDVACDGSQPRPQ